MRIAAVSLIALAGLVTSALAQEPTTETPPAPPTTAEAAGPVAEPDASPAPEAMTAPQSGQPAVTPGSQAAEPQAAPDPATNPTLPTEGNGAAVLQVLQQVCVPMVNQGRSLDEVGREAGMRRNRRDGTYSVSLGGRQHMITVFPKGANDNVCRAEIQYPVGEERPIVDALNIWAFLHEPQMELQRNDFVVGPDGVKRITLSWEHFTDSESTGLVLVQQKNPDDTPLDRRFDRATMLYSERTF